MAMREAELSLMATGKPEDKQFAKIIKSVRELRGEDVPQRPQKPSKEASREAKTTKSERFDLSTPEQATATFKQIWADRQDTLLQGGHSIELEVTDCPYTQEELAKLEAEGKRVGYLPEPLATQEARHVLGELFPKMGSYSVQKDNPVTNETVRSGWFDYEAAIDAPYRSTKEKELADVIVSQGRDGMNLTQYIIAGQDSKLLTGKYLDQTSTFVRLLGSRDEGRVVYAFFLPRGDLYVDWYLRSDYRSPNLGGRSVGVKKA